MQIATIILCALVHISALAQPLTQAHKRDAAYRWERQLVLGAFGQTPGKDAPWAAAAIEYLDDSCKWYVRTPGAPDSTAMVSKGKTLVDAGCNDPLVLATYGMALDDNRHAAGALDPLAKGVRGLKESRYHPLRLAAAATCLAEHERHHQIATEGDAYVIAIDAVAATICKAVADPLIKEYLASRLGELPSKGLGPSMCEAAVSAAMEDPNADAWVRDIFAGSAWIDRGWRARGAGTIDTVGAGARAEFDRCMVEARVCLERAIKAAPDRPQGPGRMIALAMAGGTPEGQGIGYWFQETTKAQFDYLPAYDQMINALRPRWGFSYEDLLDFGARCAATERYDTRVPFYIVEATVQLCREFSDNERAWQLEGLYDMVAGACRGLIKHPANEPYLVSDRTIFAAIACRAGRFDDAREQLAALGEGWDREAGWKVRLTRVEADELVAVFTGSAKETFLQAREAYARGDWAKARDLYSQGLSPLDANDKEARDGASEFLAMARTMAAFETGDWVDLTWDEAGYGWYGERGSWKRVDEKRIRGTARRNGLLLLNRAPLGTHWELECSIDFVGAAEGDKLNAGVIWGYEKDQDTTPRWRSWLMLLDSRTAAARVGFVGRPAEERFAPAPITPQNNRVRLTLRSRHLTAEVNGTRVFEGELPRALNRWMEGDMIGFGGHYSADGPAIELYDVRIRRMEAPPEEEPRR